MDIEKMKEESLERCWTAFRKLGWKRSVEKTGSTYAVRSIRERNKRISFELLAETERKLTKN